jgi:hypothetical protein
VKKYFLIFLSSAACHMAQAQETVPDTVIVTAGKDPVIAAIRADALDHRRKVVAQTCRIVSEDEEGKREQTRSYTTTGPDAFQWRLDSMTVNDKPATDKQMQKSLKQLEKRNKDRKSDDDERYSVFADLIADGDRIERLESQDGMRRYRINKLPKSIADDMPDAIAKRLKPILWIADAEGMPFVRRMEVNMADFRMYVVAKIKRANFDLYFDRRPDDYVKEEKVILDADYSFFGSNKFSKAVVTCDAGGPVVVRQEPQAAAK